MIVSVGKYLVLIIYLIISVILSLLIEKILNKKYKFSFKKRIIIFLVFLVLIFEFIYWFTTRGTEPVRIIY